MSGAEIAATRRGLALSQVQLAQLLGVHPLTVSKWERGILNPSPHHVAMLDSFRRAAGRDRDVGEEVATLLVTAGVAFAIYKLLEAAFENEP